MRLLLIALYKYPYLLACLLTVCLSPVWHTCTAKSRPFISRLFAIQIAAEPLYNTPLVHWTLCLLPHYGALARKPSQGTKLYCLVNRGTLGVNNLPRVVARIVPRSESNPRPLDHESSALTTTPPSHLSHVLCMSRDMKG